MTERENNPADGPGEAVIDEPTEPALDPVADPNTEWEEKAAEQIAGGESGSSGDDSEGASSEGQAEDGDSEESGS